MTPTERRRRLLRHLQGAGRPVRIERMVDAHDPVAVASLAADLRTLHAEGAIDPTPYGWVWRHA